MITPWDDCKVAFSANGDSEWYWSAFTEMGKYKQQPKKVLPNNWELNGTDCRGARLMVIFRVSGPLYMNEGEIVAGLIEQIEKEGKDGIQN